MRLQMIYNLKFNSYLEDIIDKLIYTLDNNDKYQFENIISNKLLLEEIPHNAVITYFNKIKIYLIQNKG